MEKYVVYARLVGESRWFYLSPSLDFKDNLSDNCIWHENWSYIYNLVSEDAKKYEYNFHIQKLEENKG